MTTSIGLGQTLIMGRDLADINQVMLVMIVIVVVGIVIDKCIFSVIERHVLGGDCRNRIEYVVVSMVK